MAGIAVWLAAVSPWFFYLARGLWENLQYLQGHSSFSQQSSFPANAFLLYVGRHPRVLSWGSALCGAALGILGFPACRAPKQADAAPAEKTDSPE